MTFLAIFAFLSSILFGTLSLKNDRYYKKGICLPVASPTEIYKTRHTKSECRSQVSPVYSSKKGWDWQVSQYCYPIPYKMYNFDCTLHVLNNSRTLRTTTSYENKAMAFLEHRDVLEKFDMSGHVSCYYGVNSDKVSLNVLKDPPVYPVLTMLSIAVGLFFLFV